MEALVPVPQYPFVDSFDDLPEEDQQRIRRDSREAARAFIRAYAAFCGVRYPIIETDTEAIGIERVDPIAGATRYLCLPIGELSKALLREDICSGDDSPDDVKIRLESQDGEHIVRSPRSVYTATERFPEVVSGAAAILDYVTNLRPPKPQKRKSREGEVRIEDLREEARTMFGELNVLFESLRRVAVRHPDIDHERWLALSERSGGQ